MNKAGLYFNIIATVVGIATAVSALPKFSGWQDWLTTVVIAGNVIIHVWFPGQTFPPAQ